MHLVQLSAAHLGQLGGQSAITDAIQPASGTASLAWLLVALPLLGAAILLLGGRRTNKFGPALATGLSWATFAVGALILIAMLGRSGEQRAQSLHLFSWVPAGSFKVDAGMLVDPLSMAFVMLVTFVGSLILVYSLGYMEHDPDKRRFFAYLNFFVASMLLLVLADSYLLLYVGWEGVGLASYLLIGFWNHSPANAAAANKAFVANRIGDFGVSIAIMLMFVTFGTVSFAGRQRRGRGSQQGLAHGDRPDAAARSLRQVGAVPATELARRRDGRPDAGVRADPRGDDGHRGCLPHRSQPRDLQRLADRADLRGHRRRDHLDVRRDRRVGQG